MLFRPLLTALLFLCSGTLVQAIVDYYITGTLADGTTQIFAPNTNQQAPTNSASVLEFSFGESVPIVKGNPGAAKFTNVEVTRYSDLASVTLFKASLTNQPVDITLYVTKDSTSQTTQKYAFTGVLVDGISFSEDQGLDADQETLSFKPTQVVFTTYSYNQAGTLAGTSSYCWNIKTNKSC